MHDARTLIRMGDEAVRRLQRRGFDLDVDVLAELHTRRSRIVHEIGDLRAESKRIARRIQQAVNAGDDAAEIKATARKLKDQNRELDVQLEQSENELEQFLLNVPNLPLDETPDGDSEDFAVESRRVGTPPSFSFRARDHVELGAAMGVLDTVRGTKISGPRFAVMRGVGARLERALANLLLELHTDRHGYTECSVPHLVTRRTMTGTGQLPKFEDDLFRTTSTGRERFLIPTAEVPLTNLYADEIIPPDDLPIALAAHTPCYRSEAGSYGKDTRGILRLHQFSKVEMVRICHADDSPAQLQEMVANAEACLKELDLAYRLVTLAAGDIAFAASITIDLEVWFPAQHTYREVSSVSDCGTFQARRIGIRTRDAIGRTQFVATLNGSGLPIGRTLAAVMEQHQQSDGSVALPSSLARHAGFAGIAPDGTPVD